MSATLFPHSPGERAFSRAAGIPHHSPPPRNLLAEFARGSLDPYLVHDNLVKDPHLPAQPYGHAALHHMSSPRHDTVPTPAQLLKNMRAQSRMRQHKAAPARSFTAETASPPSPRGARPVYSPPPLAQQLSYASYAPLAYNYQGYQPEPKLITAADALSCQVPAAERWRKKAYTLGS
ncbi:hypothetical protein DIPPA_09105 [Diplonema papillatum]|nr:hypothetical protein DIPPA_09105 [Diplonema papillatum]